MTKSIKYYKAFDKDFKCRGTQFTVGEILQLNEPPVICTSGFHFCQKPKFINQYYNWIVDSGIRFAEIQAIGDVVSDGIDKFATNEIKIIREIPRDEFKASCTGEFRSLNGVDYWYKEGQLHRLDGPACNSVDGSESWCKEGQFHRLDGPACKFPNGLEFWYKEGQLHRLDGPAWKSMDGEERWYKEGQFHRLDGPACKLADGSEFWYKEGQLHRVDGPAKKFADGEERWRFR